MSESDYLAARRAAAVPAARVHRLRGSLNRRCPGRPRPAAVPTAPRVLAGREREREVWLLRWAIGQALGLAIALGGLAHSAYRDLRERLFDAERRAAEGDLELRRSLDQALRRLDAPGDRP